MKRTRTAAVVAAVALLATPLQAWDNFGHMVVAGVAYRQLDATAKARVNALLALNPYFQTKWPSQIPSGTSSADRAMMIFMLAATWADAIKSDSHYHNDGANGGDSPTGPEATRNTGYDDFNRHKYWHFIDLPFSQDDTSVSTFQVRSPNAQTQIAVFRGVLSSTSAADPLKSYDLVWLLHLIGDVHQPLHSSDRLSSLHPQGDAGGNDVVFCGATATTCGGKLHAFWDDILGAGSLSAANQFAAGITPPALPASDVANARRWINESLGLAEGSVYVPPVGANDGPFRATADYTSSAQALARVRVALAGARLAAVLKSDLR